MAIIAAHSSASLRRIDGGHLVHEIGLRPFVLSLRFDKERRAAFDGLDCGAKLSRSDAPIALCSPADKEESVHGGDCQEPRPGFNCEQPERCRGDCETDEQTRRSEADPEMQVLLAACVSLDAQQEARIG